MADVEPQKNPSTWREVARLNMCELKALLQRLDVPVSGRTTKVDLQEKVLLALHISTTGGCSATDSLTPLVKASIPLDVIPFYQRAGPFAAVSTSDAKLWTKDLRRCPEGFSYARVEKYLIDSPDKAFDGDSMRSYKALRAYQLFEERHIHNVEFCPTWPDAGGLEESPLCFFRCLCYPSQDTQKQPYRVVLCVDKRSGQPYGGHCRCVSGLGEACSHVAGLLFAINDFVLRGFRSLPDSQSTTDVLCKWSKPSEGRKVNALPLSEVSLRKAVSGGRKEQTKWERETPLSKYDPRLPADRPVSASDDRVSCLMEELRAEVGGCGILRNYDNDRRRPLDASAARSEGYEVESLPDVALELDVSVVPSNEVVITAAPSTSTELGESLVEKRQRLLFDLAGPVPVMDGEAVPDLEQHARRIAAAMALTAEAREELERSTAEQSKCERWHAEHVGRVTASVAHRAMTAAASRTPDKLIRDIMRYNERKEVRWSDPRQHGLRLEPMARQAYIRQKKAEGNSISVEERGLVVSPDHPFLATSSDGYVTESCTDGTGVLEIKCPVTKLCVTDFAATRRNCYLSAGPDGALKLKESHAYYTQVQFEMAVSGCSWADFVVFSLPEDDDDESIFVQRIPFCESFWMKKLLPALSAFFSKCIALELLTRRVQRSVPLLSSA